ncbi:MAG: zinc-binding dehydrogenase [Bacteroidales bacterium]|nr:zinc-binding dehydrogenase [Bacteroidales bacterium]
MKSTYKAIQYPVYQTNIIKSMLSLTLVDKGLPKPVKNQILIRMEAAQANPSDIAFLQGGYNVKKTLPCVPGFEGCGIVSSVGEGLVESDWIGKRVVCFTQHDKDGTWAEYFLADVDEVIQVDPRLRPEQAAGFFINPFTAWGLTEIALQRQSPCIVINAAGGQVAMWLLALAKKHRIKTIGIVRKPETVDALQNEGFDQLLASSGDDFQEKLSKLVVEMHATTAFDAVAGEMTGQLVNCLPYDSEVVVYGGLSGKPVSGIDFMSLIFRNAMITGFNLNDWLVLNETGKKAEIGTMLTEMILSGDIQPRVQSEVDLADFMKGLRSYLSSMSAGKVLIRF